MPDPGKVDYLVNTLGQNLDAYEKILGKQPYLAGDQVTLADLSVSVPSVRVSSGYRSTAFR